MPTNLTLFPRKMASIPRSSPPPIRKRASPRPRSNSALPTPAPQPTRFPARFATPAICPSSRCPFTTPARSIHTRPPSTGAMEVSTLPPYLNRAAGGLCTPITLTSPPVYSGPSSLSPTMTALRFRSPRNRPSPTPRPISVHFPANPSPKVTKRACSSPSPTPIPLTHTRPRSTGATQPSSLHPRMASRLRSRLRLELTLTGNSIEFLEWQSPEQRQWYNGIVNSLFDEFSSRKREPSP